MTDQWDDWLDSEGVQKGNALATPSHELIAMWVIEAYWTLKTEICKREWKNEGFEWVVQSNHNSHN